MKTSEEIRQRAIERLDSSLKFPSMCFYCATDLEMHIQRMISDLWFIDDIVKEDHYIANKLVAEGAYVPSNVVNGVGNVFRNLMPSLLHKDDSKLMAYICSVYARESHRFGYLNTETLLSSIEFMDLYQRIMAGEFSKGFNLDALLKVLPAPTFNVKGSVLCYASENINLGWIYFDLPSNYNEEKGYQYTLISIRWPAETLEEGFELTKEGYDQTDRGIAIPKFDDDTFIEEWKAGKTWRIDESLPVILEAPRESRWKHLW